MLKSECLWSELQIEVLHSCLKFQAVQSEIDHGIGKCSGQKVRRDVIFESDGARAEAS